MNLFVTMNYPFEEKKYKSRLEEIYDIDGVTGIRINLCRYEKDDYKKAVDFFMKILEEPAKDYQLAFDLPFPRNKSRILAFNLMTNEIERSRQYSIVVTQPKNKNEIQVMGKHFSEDLKNGDILYYGDGDGIFEIIKAEDEKLQVVALNSFLIWKNKAITGNVSQNDIQTIKPLINLTELTSAPEKMIFFPSFVTCQNEVEKLREMLYKKALIIPKIECYKSCETIDETIDKSDGTLLARGDMAYYMGITNILEIERYVGKRTQEQGKRLFAATDILESLQKNAIPLRADITDVCVLNEIGCTDLIISNAFSNIRNVVSFLNLL